MRRKLREGYVKILRHRRFLFFAILVLFLERSHTILFLSALSVSGEVF